MWVLISFCNAVKRSRHYSKHGLSQLAALNLATSKIYFLKIPKTLNSQGFTGIAHNGKFIYTVTQGEKQSSFFVRIQKDGLKVDLVKKVRHLVDPHSMVYFRDRLFVVSSGTNSIEMFDPRTFRYLGRYWQYPQTTTHVDQVHLNSLCEANGELWASSFGPKVKDRWSLTSGGSLINTVDGSTCYRIYHPHSVTFFADDLYYCESWTGLVFRNNKPIKKIEGAYVRGLDVNSNYIVIGANSGRIRSKSRGTLNDPRDVGKYNFISGVLVLNKRRKHELYFDLSKYSREIEEYTHEIYAIKFIYDIILNDLGNIISSHKLDPSPTIEKNYVASLLMGENQKLRIALGKATEERHELEEIIRRAQQSDISNAKPLNSRKVYTGIKQFLKWSFTLLSS